VSTCTLVQARVSKVNRVQQMRARREQREERQITATGMEAASDFSDSVYGALATPRSVKIAAI